MTPDARTRSPLRGVSTNSPLVRIPALDGLRGVAVVVVLSMHSFMVAVSSATNAVDHAANLTVRILGPLGVDLFFVLSGFLITSILDATRASTHPFRTFYVRRVLRIAPLYYVYLLIVPIVFASLGPAAIGTPLTRRWDWLFAANVAMSLQSSGQLGFLFNHLWSLSIEEHFYFLWPLVVLLSPQKWLPALCLALIGLSLGARVTLVLTGHPSAAWFLMPSRMEGLVAGAWIALMQVRKPEVFNFLRSRFVVPATFAALGAVVTLVGSFFWHTSAGVLESFSTEYTGRKLEIVIAPFVGSLVFAVWVALLTGEQRNRGPIWLRRGLLARMGRYGYGMYLFHVPIAVILARTIPQHAPVAGFDLPYQLLIAGLVIMVSTAVGWATWTMFEARILSHSPPYAYETANPVDPPMDAMSEAALPQ